MMSRAVAGLQSVLVVAMLFLAACTVYASLYGKSPVGNSYDYYGRIDKETAAFLQKVADETVKKFYGR